MSTMWSSAHQSKVFYFLIKFVFAKKVKFNLMCLLGTHRNGVLLEIEDLMLIEKVQLD